MAVVEDAVVALLGTVLDSVVAVGRQDAARRAAAVGAVVVDRAVIALLGRGHHAVAALARPPAGDRAIGIVGPGRLALRAVRVLNDAVPAARSELAVGQRHHRIAAVAIGAVVRAVVALLLRALHPAVAAVAGALALVRAAAVGTAVGAVVALLAVFGLHDQVTAARGQLATGATAAHRAVGVVVAPVVAGLGVGHHHVAAVRPELAVRRALVVAARIVCAVVALL